MPMHLLVDSGNYFFNYYNLNVSQLRYKIANDSSYIHDHTNHPHVQN
jgi:hypothetical protein